MSPRNRNPSPSRRPATPLPKPDPAKTTIEGWKPRRLPGGEWGAVLTGPNVAQLPDNHQLPRTPIVVTDNKGDSWTTTLVDVASRTDTAIVVRTSRPATRLKAKPRARRAEGPALPANRRTTRHSGETQGRPGSRLLAQPRPLPTRFVSTERGQWGAVLTGPDVAGLPSNDQLPRTPVVVTDNKDDSWTTGQSSRPPARRAIEDGPSEPRARRAESATAARA